MQAIFTTKNSKINTIWNPHFGLSQELTLPTAMPASVEGFDWRTCGSTSRQELCRITALSIVNTKPLFTRVFSSHFSASLFHRPRAPTPCPPTALPLAPSPGLGLHAQRRTPWRAPRPGAPWARRATGSPPSAAPERSQRASRPVACGRAGCWLRVTGNRPPHAGSAANVFSPAEQLDYALVRLTQSPLQTVAAGDDLKSLSPFELVLKGKHRGYLLPNESFIPAGMPINIIQHPYGDPMKVVLTQNQMVEDMTDTRVRYLADTDKGSSGSPVFDQKWDIVALHHSGGPYPPQAPRTTAGKRIVNRFNEGIPMQAILKDLRKVSLMCYLRNRFVASRVERAYPTLVWRVAVAALLGDLLLTLLTLLALAQGPAPGGTPGVTTITRTPPVPDANQLIWFVIATLLFALGALAVVFLYTYKIQSRYYDVSEGLGRLGRTVKATPTAAFAMPEGRLEGMEEGESTTLNVIGSGVVTVRVESDEFTATLPDGNPANAATWTVTPATAATVQRVTPNSGARVKVTAAVSGAFTLRADVTAPKAAVARYR
jgi:hypothetical protein